MSKENEQEKLEQDIDALELHDKDEEEIERVIKAFSEEGLKLRRERKNVRYQLYRLKSEAEGRAANVSDPGFKEIFENQTFFDGWRRFSESWDVALDDPYRIVHRIRSVGEDWDAIVEAKFPRIEPGGKVVYPDITVRKRVEQQAELDALERAKAKAKKDSDSE